MRGRVGYGLFPCSAMAFFPFSFGRLVFWIVGCLLICVGREV